MKIGIVGCGYVADFYLTTLGLHPELEVAGLVDQRPERALLRSVSTVLIAAFMYVSRAKARLRSSPRLPRCVSRL